MADFSKLNGYDVCDSFARDNISYFNENIENLNTQFNNLTDSVNELNNDLNELSNIINSREKLVVFGDSWSDLNVEGTVWSEKVSDILNLELHNYAKNGAGFIQPSSNLIETQINTFISSEINKDYVKYIVILGGINDYRNNVNIYDLSDVITNLVQNLSSICTNAKILYVSNCQYPYNKTQSTYWRNLHNYLSTKCLLPTYNMDGNYGKALFNTDNYFHLTTAGQEFMTRNIISCLTGGELIKYQDTRSFENNNIKIKYSVEKLSSNANLIHVALTPKVEATNYSLSLNDNEPNLSYGSDISMQGIVSYFYTNIICQVEAKSFTIASDSALKTDNKTYTIDYIVLMD